VGVSQIRHAICHRDRMVMMDHSVRTSLRLCECQNLEDTLGGGAHQKVEEGLVHGHHGWSRKQFVLHVCVARCPVRPAAC
jgi:hypothetical protein